jgi:hypothetical protein
LHTYVRISTVPDQSVRELWKVPTPLTRSLVVSTMSVDGGARLGVSVGGRLAPEGAESVEPSIPVEEQPTTATAAVNKTEEIGFMGRNFLGQWVIDNPPRIPARCAAFACQSVEASPEVRIPSEAVNLVVRII